MSRSKIEEIKNKVLLSEMFSRYTDIQKKGAGFVCKCPFHKENTASCFISDSKQLYKCFGCGKSGDLISFFQEIEGLGFTDAIGRLADMANVQLDAYDSETRKQYAIQKNIIKSSLLFYHSHVSTVGRYLSERGIKQETIDRFKLGWGKGGLYPFLIGRGFKREDILASGVCIETVRGVIDFFRDRLVIPISDKSGTPVGFTGRVVEGLTSNYIIANSGKYINSKESLLFNKSSVLFNLYNARSVKLPRVYVMEGQFDVITALQKGYPNSVATSGTSISSIHLNILSTNFDEIVLMMDNDEAGRRAVKAVFDKMNFIRVPVFVAMYEGKDPDDFFSNGGDMASVRKVPIIEAVINNTLSVEDGGERRLAFFELNQSIKKFNPLDKFLANDAIRNVLSRLKYS